MSRTTLQWHVCLVALVLATYCHVVGHQFVSYDDNLYVTGNPIVQAGVTGSGLAWGWNTPYAANWHPFTWFAYMGEFQVFGHRAGCFALVNVLVHAANTLLVFGLLLRLTKRRFAAGLAAALFGIHPMNVESVAWVSQLKSVYCLAFSLLALHCWVSWLDTRRRGWYGATLVLFVVGLLFKPMFVTFAAVLLLMDFWPLRRWEACAPFDWSKLARLVGEKLPFLLIVLPVCFLAAVAQTAGGAVTASTALPLAARLASASSAYVRYLGMALAPHNHAILYPFEFHPAAWKLPLALVILAETTVLAVAQWKRSPWIAFGWLFFLGTLIPMIGLIQVGAQSVADRYLYLPMLGLCIAVAWTVDMVRAGRQFVRLASGVVVAGLAVACFRQTLVWRDSDALFSQAIQNTSENTILRANLAGSMTSQAITEYSDRPEDVSQPLKFTPAGKARLMQARQLLRESEQTGAYPAVVALQQGVVERLLGNSAASLAALERAGKGEYEIRYEAFLAKGVLLWNLERPEESLNAFLQGLTYYPYRRNRASGFPAGGAVTDMRRYFEAKASRQPDNSNAWLRVGEARFAAGALAAAKEAFATAADLEPAMKPRALQRLGILQAVTGDTATARASFSEAARLNPDDTAIADNLAALARQEKSFAAKVGASDSVWTLAALKLHEIL